MEHTQADLQPVMLLCLKGNRFKLDTLYGVGHLWRSLP
jgi:hypothetical protein